MLDGPEAQAEMKENDEDYLGIEGMELNGFNLEECQTPIFREKLGPLVDCIEKALVNLFLLLETAFPYSKIGIVLSYTNIYCAGLLNERKDEKTRKDISMYYDVLKKWIANHVHKMF